ncbi:hypothetical protein LTS08_001165 [Lithohypha guttulata]|nr:hypothetical protein LTS08_001165 [Lithohypha guttulata]
MRTKGAAIGTATNWMCNFIVVEITPIGIQSLGWQFYIIWVVFNAAFVPTVYLYYPETADRTIEDLDAYYRERVRLCSSFVTRTLPARKDQRYMWRLSKRRLEELAVLIHRLSDGKAGFRRRTESTAIGKWATRALWLAALVVMVVRQKRTVVMELKRSEEMQEHKGMF